jgi:hypothetical protein
MKKIIVGCFIVLMLLLVPMLGTAAVEKVISESLTFEWDQLEADLPDIAGWTLYMSSVSGSGYVKVVDIPYTVGTVADGTTVFVSPANMSISGVSGSTVTKYFVLTSKNAINQESEYSNEVSNAFVIPYGIPTKPFSLKIKVVVK